MIEKFLNDKVVLHCGDCLDVLATLEECSLDSCVTDPPYHLTSIVKRFGAPNSAPVKVSEFYQGNGESKGSSPYKRSSAGFMGKLWDGGDIAFDPETWRAVLRVLKPGAHLLAFGGTRTYHRMACAIEDAGFEIRDCIQWLYGSGFPKSHDVSKRIDRRGGAEIGWFGPWLRQERERRDIAQKELARHFPSKTGGLTGCVRNWELGFNLPTVEQFNTLCAVLDLPFDRIEEAEREVIGQSLWTNSKHHFVPGEDHTQRVQLDLTAPATDAARQWAGWGTALKPACELIVLARKPLSEGTVAANVLRWGTGAINVDGCRVASNDGFEKAWDKSVVTNISSSSSAYAIGKGTRHTVDLSEYRPNGRWPANVIHDGSEEVVAAFPESDGANGGGARLTRSDYRGGGDADGSEPHTFSDSGSATRFFYTAKADSDDRLGSKHPTVKPLDLMQYLVRLVTPKGGTCLDPFAGTGTTGEAAWREGMRAVLIEAEAEYQADIRRRMALALAGPDERVRESIKAKNLPRDDGPLFAQLYNATDDFARSIDEAYREIRDRKAKGGPGWGGWE
jgi:site-specific DNA-methyltransferase (adenine-specific)